MLPKVQLLARWIVGVSYGMFIVKFVDFREHYKLQLKEEDYDVDDVWVEITSTVLINATEAVQKLPQHWPIHVYHMHGHVLK